MSFVTLAWIASNYHYSTWIQCSKLLRPGGLSRFSYSCMWTCDASITVQQCTCLGHAFLLAVFGHPCKGAVSTFTSVSTDDAKC